METRPFRVLSIDFDYFFDMSECLAYPYLTRSFWLNEYITHTTTFPKQLRFREAEFAQVKEFLRATKTPIYVSENHSHVYTVLAGKHSDIEIVNLDQHPDVARKDMPALLEPRNLYCGNWVSLLDGLCNLTYHWVTSPQSAEYWGANCHNAHAYIAPPWDTTHPMRLHTELGNHLEGPWDAVFLIQSYEYSPSHLQHRFYQLLELCKDPVIDDMYPLYRETLLSEADGLQNCSFQPSQYVLAVCQRILGARDTSPSRPPFSWQKYWAENNIEFDPYYFTDDTLESRVKAEPLQKL